MKHSLYKTISLFVIFILLLPTGAARAQDTQPNGPVYIVQEGDSVWTIAARFHLSTTELAQANGIGNADQISTGQHLLIPGLEGVQGILTTETVPYGETLKSLSLRYDISPKMLRRLNRITSPGEVYAGYSLIIAQNNGAAQVGKRTTLAAGQSMMELAILNSTETWNLMAANKLESSWAALPGDTLRAAGEEDTGPGALPAEITLVEIPRLVQGLTADILVETNQDLNLTGTLMEHPLNFFAGSEGEYFALQGIHAMAEPGMYPLTLEATTGEGAQYRFSQMVIVREGDFPYDRSLPVDPATMDPETNRAENELWTDSAAGVTTEKLWNGSLFLPVDLVFDQCYTSRFGNRRSYNGGPYLYFHTGVDFCGQVGNSIYAAAPGVVVFLGELTVRGKATMIDHGMGVFTAYMHQSEVMVEEGDLVEEGQLIGKVGTTGRVEGPHLHFEVIVGGVQVDPLEWFIREFP